MAKAVKKNRRLKRSVRKTLGALLLASAIVVAAIPVDGLQAASTKRTDKKVTLALNKETTAENRSNIPDVDADDEIYTTGDGRFQFAYIYPAGYTSGPKIAVILGYQKGGKLDGGRLEIPNTVDAYKKFSNVSTESGYAAVNKAGDFLYYRDYEYVYNEFGEPVYETTIDGETGLEVVKVDEYGNPIRKRKVVYKVCFYEDRAKWEEDDYNDEELYYYLPGQDPSDDRVIPTLVTTDDKDRICDAEVWYIGNQYLTDDASGGWTVGGDITEGSQGIFAGAANISTLLVGEDLTGIGNYAFFGCAGMKSITLNNGLDTIGNYAFANCVNMTDVNIDISSNVSIIGERAFYNCQALTEFVMPRAVTKIGDSAFEDCYAMKELELTGMGSNVLLQEVGYDAFAGCANLESITFPRTYAEELDVTTFRGCSSLEFIATSANRFDLKDGDDPDYTIADFKENMIPTFYLKGNKDEVLHKTATANEIAFSYYDTSLKRDVYELTVVEDDGGTPDYGGDDKKVVYRVDDNDELVYCQMDTGLTTVTLPTQIGPNFIKKIDQFTFQNKCSLQKITIPASITEISQYAFKGCHNLQDVIFVDATNLRSIGKGAFLTQDCNFHENGCSARLEKTPFLNFVGEISYDSEPFRYAMSPAEKINVGTQDETYITYYSGWPTNLVVRYDSETDKNVLIDYPTFKDIQSGTKYVVKTASGGYAYMTKDYENAAKKAVQKYLGTYRPDATDPNDTETLTDYEKEIIRAAINIVLPEGIESIGRVEMPDGTTKGLFEYNEKENELATDNLGNGLVLRKTITAHSLSEVADEAFKGCKYLSGITLKGDTKSIGNYAFAECAVLTTASVPASVKTLGLRPFTGCDLLEDVDFNGSSYFDTVESIIFELSGSGKPAKVVEYLNGRSSTSVGADDLEGVTEIYPEAFQDTNVSMVDLSKSAIANVSKYAFQDTLKLYSVTLPTTCKSIEEDAFSDSALQQLHIPDSVTIINNNAFRDMHDAMGKPGTDGLTNLSILEFECVEGSSAYLFAQQNNIKTSTYIPKVYYTVTFWDWNGTLLKTQEMVEAGTDALPPEVPGREGYKLSGWVPDYRGVTSDLAVTAQYDAIDPDTLKVTVTFLDHDDTVIKQVRVMPGESAEPPADPVREGYLFIGWQNSYENVQEDTTIYARYEKIDSSAYQLTVRFIDWDDTVLKIAKVNPGEDAEPPRDPVRTGYNFTGWRNSYKAVTQNVDVYAEYERIDSSDLKHTVTFYDWDDKVLYTQKVDDGASAIIPQSPTREGYTFVEWRPLPTKVTKDMDVYAIYVAGTGGGIGGVGGGTGGIGGTGGTSKTYTLTVVNGSGSGSYVAGSQPIIICDEPSASQEFSHWTVEPADAKMGSKVLTATYIVMPEADVTVKAHYKEKEGGSSGTNRPSSGTVNSGNTTVVIDKNGLSNTGVVSVVVNGSSDNFTIKIAESTSATEAVIKALQNEYGDISNLKYFPMDITLYDSTGTKKITDTTGLSIRITLPLPDSLAAYAGNNKVAGVVNGKLDKLSAKFTTINGVACISFTAEHFSPYVIYVDTKNATVGGGSGSGSTVVPDDTPKTGDGIHPKWFLSIGLACLSFVMFMKRDKKQKVKVRA